MLDRQESLSTQVSENDVPASLGDIERQHICQLMEQYKGNRKDVANALGISERTIYRKLKRLGIN
jgi:two-component system, NtrC family, response regulator AtoC